MSHTRQAFPDGTLRRRSRAGAPTAGGASVSSPSLAEAGNTSVDVDATSGGGRGLRRWLLLAFGTGLLVFYLQGLDYASVLDSAQTFPVAVAVGVVALNLLPGGIKYLRWRHLLSERGLGVSGFSGYLAINASFFLGLVTPGTAGELSRAWVSESEQPGRATAVVAFEKLTDLAVLLLLVTGSAAVHFTEGPLTWGLVALMVGGAGGLYALFLAYDGLLTGFLEPLLMRALSEERRESLRRAYWDFYELVRQRDLFLLSAAVSLGLWLTALAQMKLITVGLGWALPLETVALILFLPYLVGVLSLIPMGLGAFELSMAQVVDVGVGGAAVGGAGALAPLFFRFLVTLPLIVGGYACHLALVAWHRRRE